MGSRELCEEVSAADMEQMYQFTRDRHLAEQLREAMLAWVRSVPANQCGIPMMQKIAERRFNDLAVCILTEVTPDERLRIWPGMSPTTITMPGEVVKWVYKRLDLWFHSKRPASPRSFQALVIHVICVGHGNALSVQTSRATHLTPKQMVELFIM